jgi:hypothetical protein
VEAPPARPGGGAAASGEGTNREGTA